MLLESKENEEELSEQRAVAKSLKREEEVRVRMQSSC